MPFSSSHKFQATIHKQARGTDKEIILIKGAPEIIVEKCSYYLNKHSVKVPTDNYFHLMLREATELLVNKVIYSYLDY